MTASFLKWVMSLFAERRKPYVVWRNPAIPYGMRKVEFRNKTWRAKEYAVLERKNDQEWYLVSVLSVLESARKFPAKEQIGTARRLHSLTHGINRFYANATSSSFLHL